MKKLKWITAVLAMAAVLFAGCSGGSDDDDEVKLEEVPGTVGVLPEKLLKSSELAKRLDPDNQKVILFYYEDGVDASTKVVYNWVSSGNETNNLSFTTDSQTGISCANFSDASNLSEEVKNAITNGEDFNFIIKPSEVNNWAGQTADLTFALSLGIKHIIYFNGDVYTVSENMRAGFTYARMETLSTMKVELGVKYALEGVPSANGFTITADDNSIVPIKDIVNYNARDNRAQNNTNLLYITLSSPINAAKTWTISHEAFGSQEISTANAVKISLNDYKYEGDDLGLTLKDGKATFKVWAPIASDVQILLYDDVSKVGTFKPETVAAKAIGSTTEKELIGMPAKTDKMTLDTDSGIWSYTLDSSDTYKYYKYQIKNNGETYYVCDIYAKAASADSIAAQITDINEGTTYGKKEGYKNPFGDDGKTDKDNSEAVIYEMHIRDWSRAVNSSSTGKFNEMCDDTIIAHLKDLGVTHVQILPMFDYAQVNTDEKYNWGYNPYHYNVPEGRYVENMKDGMDAVDQMRAMVKKFHDNDIAVIMDVVYNHTSGTQGGSLYDSTVPYYYYRLNSDGSYSNGSGCGNETDSEAPMFRKYMIDTLKHWMLDYHINGFRFDLMGLHSKEAMTEIYKALSEIDQNVMVYGEPWTGGTSPVTNGMTGAISAGGYGVGAFDDDFRDSIKGAEFGGFKTGQVQGEKSDDGIRAGLRGKSGKNKRNETGEAGLALHYVECHDNFTLYDKLVYSLKENLEKAQKADSKGEIATVFPKSITAEQRELIKKQDKLAAAYVFLSQGTPFINGGQEFMRTKKGNPDSYSADTKGGIKWTNEPGQYNIDDCNTIDLGFKEAGKYDDVYNTYRALIALRKSSDAFTNGTASTAKTLSKGVTLYNAKSVSEEFEVIFNATDSEYVLTDTTIEGNLGLGMNDYSVSFGRKGKRVTIDENAGTYKIADKEETVSTVPAKSFVILKK